MNNSHVKGTVRDIKGRVKENVGHATGDASLAGEGVVDRVKGKIEKSFGDLKDAVKSGIDRALNHKAN